MRGDVREPQHPDLQPDAGDDRICRLESRSSGVAKAAAMGLGTKGLMEDMGVGVEVQVNTVSSAAQRRA